MALDCQERSPYAKVECGGEFNEFSLEIKQSGKIVTCKINSLSNEQQSTPEFMKPSRFYFNNDIAVIDLRNFSSPDFTHFVDSAFTQIANKGTHSLIIDLRYNGGGEATLADSLISYLTTKEYRSMQSDLIKISSVTKDYIMGLQEMKLGERKGDYYIWNGVPVKPATRINSFNGSLYVLTSYMTYSTGGFFANVVKCYRLGTIIGSETGQPMIAYGDTYTYILPNTNLPCGIAKQKFAFCCAKKEGQGVVPDFKVEHNLNDKLKGIDTEMEFTLKMIKDKK